MKKLAVALLTVIAFLGGKAMAYESATFNPQTFQVYLPGTYVPLAEIIMSNTYLTYDPDTGYWRYAGHGGASTVTSMTLFPAAPYAYATYNPYSGELSIPTICNSAAINQCLENITLYSVGFVGSGIFSLTAFLANNGDLDGMYRYVTSNPSRSGACDAIEMILSGQTTVMGSSGDIEVVDKTASAISLKLRSAGASGSTADIVDGWIPLTGGVTGSSFSVSHTYNLSQSGVSFAVSTTMTGTVNSSESFSGTLASTILISGYGYSDSCTFQAGYSATR